jgi:DNA-binding transcriptional LysR family regulator
VISLHQLRTFVEVADAGSVRIAAERLVVSQPAVSAALATLQREIGAPLFERDGRGLRLTEAGKTMERYARRILALIDEGTHQARVAAEMGAGVLRIGAVTTVAEHVLPELLRGFRAEYGDVVIELQVVNRNNVWKLLENWDVDLVLGGRPPPRDDFVTIATRSNELAVIARPGSGAMDIEALARETWLLREPGSGTRVTTEEFFESLGIAPTCLTIGSNGAIREGVRCGLGIALLARDAVNRELAEGILEIVTTPATPLERAWHLVAAADRERSQTVARFVEYLTEVGAFIAAEPERNDMETLDR